MPSSEPVQIGVIDSEQTPGVGHSLVTTDPRAAAYYNNPEAVNTGKHLFSQYNCSGCHSNGGGGMGPDLMDDVWIYGSRLEQIHQTLGRWPPERHAGMGRKGTGRGAVGPGNLRKIVVVAPNDRGGNGQHALPNAGSGPSRGRSRRGLGAAAGYDQRLHIDDRRCRRHAKFDGDRLGRRTPLRRKRRARIGPPPRGGRLSWPPACS